MTLSAVVIGDLHLDGMEADLGEEANALQIREVAKAEAWAVSNSIPEVWYLGDICNRTVMSYSAHLRLFAQWSKYPHLMRRVILGNHDFAEVGVHSLVLFMKAMAPTLSHVHIYESPITETIGGVPVNFLPYPYPDVEWEGDLEDSINVGHFEVKGSTRDNGTASSGGKPVMKSSYWVMGHLHTPHDVGRVHYVGTLYQRNFGESLPKSFSWLKARVHKGEIQVKLTRVPNDPSFKLITLDIQSDEDLLQVDDNPLNKYKLVVSEAARLTDNFLLSHPNVVRHDGYKTKQERQLLLEEIDVAQVVDEGNPFYLRDYWEIKHAHLTEKQITRGEAILADIRADLGV